MSTRQEQDSTAPKGATSNVANQSRIDELATELDQFLRPGGMMLITDQENQDIDFQRSARHLIRLKNIQLTSALVKLQLQELQEKEEYLFPKVPETSTSNVTGPFISHRGEDTPKPNQNTDTSKNASGSKSSTSKQTKSSTQSLQ